MAREQQIQARAAAELRCGEQLYWSGSNGSLPRAACSMLVLFIVLVWVVFTVAAWRIGCCSGSLPWGVVVAGIPLVVTWMLLRKIRAYMGTVCMLTNHRVAWLYADGREVLSLPLTENMIRNVVMKAGGVGDIVFCAAADDAAAVFYNVPQVRAVVRLINDLSAGR